MIIQGISVVMASIGVIVCARDFTTGHRWWGCVELLSVAVYCFIYYSLE